MSSWISSDRSPLWRFAEGIEQLPLVALFVRDALALDVPGGGNIPPRLESRLRYRSRLLDGGQRAAAAASWRVWWQLVLAREMHKHRGAPDGMDQLDWMRQCLARHRGVFDPPEFASQATESALRHALRATFEEALRWADEQRAWLAPADRSGQFDHDAARRVVRGVTRRHRLGPEDVVHACAVVLPVEGSW